MVPLTLGETQPFALVYTTLYVVVFSGLALRLAVVAPVFHK